MKKFKKTFLSILVTAFLALATFVGGGALLQNTGANSASVENGTKSATSSWQNKNEDYVPDKESAFYAAYNNLSSTEYSKPNENVEYDLAELGSVVIDLTNFNKSTLASIGLKEDAVETKANATLSATLEHGKMNIVVSCQYGNRYLEASTDAEAILGEHFTGGAPVKLSGTKILTNNNRNSLMAVALHSAKIAEVTAGTLTLSNATYGGTSTSNRVTGRGIYMSGGTVNIGASAIIRYYNSYALSSDKNGAGIWAAGGTLNLNGGTITGCYAVNGGGVYCVNSSNTLALSDCTITGNTASSNGGGVYCDGSIFISDGTVISSNRATNGCGGGVYACDSSVDNIGGVDCTKSFSMNGGIIGNSSASSTVTSSNCSNYAGQDGGGIYIKCLITSITEKYDPRIKGNYAVRDGGGMVLWGVQMNDSFMEYANLFYNCAGRNGGGLYAASNLNYIGSFNFTGNAATYGGGMYSDAWVRMHNCSFSSNIASCGGGLYSGEGGSSSELVGCSFSSNTATGVGGGAIALVDCDFTIDGGTISECYADDCNGGAIYLTGSSVLNTLGDLLIFRCSCRHGDGGAIYAIDDNTNAPRINIEATTFEECSSDNGGGAIWCKCDARDPNQTPLLRIGLTNNVTFMNCSADLGGAIYSYIYQIEIGSNHSGYVDFSNCNAVGNGYGGAIYVWDNIGQAEEYNSEVHITGAEFSWCRASFGGALYLGYGNFAAIGSVDNGVTFHNNSAIVSKDDGGNGGAIYNRGTIRNNEQANFLDNSADCYGADIYNVGTFINVPIGLYWFATELYGVSTTTIDDKKQPNSLTVYKNFANNYNVLKENIEENKNYTEKVRQDIWLDEKQRFLNGKSTLAVVDIDDDIELDKLMV